MMIDFGEDRSEPERALETWWNQIDQIRKIEQDFLYHDATRKSKLASIAMQYQKIKNCSFNVAESFALSTQEYQDFMECWSHLKAQYNDEYRKLEILKKNYEAKYLKEKQEFNATGG